MSYVKKWGGVLVFGIILFLSFARIPAQAVAVNTGRKELSYFESIKDKNVWNYPSITLYLGNTYINESAYLINDTTYVPLRAAATLAGATVGFDDSTRTASVKMENLDMSVTDGSYIVYANGRPLLSKTPSIILSDGRMYIPVRSLAKALSFDVEWLPPRSVALHGTATPLQTWEKYYRSDDLYWLSRIISAESQGEPLLGQIAVGNVVLNRMRHSDYPNTIWGVIFDRKHGVQFSPVSNGTVYKAPNSDSIIAAKICLEGYSINTGILYFVNPRVSPSNWIINNRAFYAKIGNHAFYY